MRTFTTEQLMEIIEVQGPCEVWRTEHWSGEYVKFIVGRSDSVCTEWPGFTDKGVVDSSGFEHVLDNAPNRTCVYIHEVIDGVLHEHQFSKHNGVWFVAPVCFWSYEPRDTTERKTPCTPSNV